MRMVALQVLRVSLHLRYAVLALLLLSTQAGTGCSAADSSEIEAKKALRSRVDRLVKADDAFKDFPAFSKTWAKGHNGWELAAELGREIEALTQKEWWGEFSGRGRHRDEARYQRLVEDRPTWLEVALEATADVAKRARALEEFDCITYPKWDDGDDNSIQFVLHTLELLPYRANAQLALGRSKKARESALMGFKLTAIASGPHTVANLGLITWGATINAVYSVLSTSQEGGRASEELVSKALAVRVVKPSFRESWIGTTALAVHHARKLLDMEPAKLKSTAEDEYDMTVVEYLQFYDELLSCYKRIADLLPANTNPLRSSDTSGDLFSDISRILETVDSAVTKRVKLDLSISMNTYAFWTDVHLKVRLADLRSKSFVEAKQSVEVVQPLKVLWRDDRSIVVWDKDHAATNLLSDSLPSVSETIPAVDRE